MNERHMRAHAACAALIRLGLNQNEIAHRSGLDPSTISRITNVHKDDGFYVSEKTVGALERSVPNVLKEKCEIALSDLPITVLETCNNTGTVVDEQVRAEIRQTFLMSLSHSFNSESPVSLPKGIEGAIASLGDELYLIKLQHQVGDDVTVRANRRLLFIHELEHLIQRLREGLPDQKPPRRIRSAF